ncbi:immunoglobulin superfamily member 6 isoform X2 [Pteropus alecto]|uniref:immunoglobulin superfamily member 6 isoform X2 n=1 Tax=Pteropus alecto TaxID=9402 RepID=UPI000D535CD2|nr:immunoglobulin superfamily member 6 isoform X2 [Pteropus alecto]
MFTQFQKVPDYGSLIRLPLFSSSVPKREKKKARGHHTHTRTHTHAHAHARAHSEMEAMDAGKITLGLELGLILFYVGAAGNCTVSVSQPPVLEVDYTQGAVTVPCSFSTTGCPSQPPTSLWFRLGAQQLESLCSDGCQSEADKFTVRTDLAHSQVSLTVNRVTANDSAIYICGIAVTSSKAPQAKRAGEGTVLVVRGTRVLGKEVRWLLTALTSLLSIYLVGLVVVFSVLSASKPNTRRNKETEDSQKKMSARRIFQEIAQELYSKRHAGRSQQHEKDNTYENRSARCNYEGP